MKTFIRIFLYDYDFIFMRILFVCYVFIYIFYLYIRCLSEIYLSKIYEVIFLRMFYILRFINMIVLSLSYIVYRKEQSKTRGKSGEKIGRKYDQISQIIKKKCYL